MKYQAFMKKFLLSILLTAVTVLANAQSGVVIHEDFNSLTSGIPAGWSNTDNTIEGSSYNWSYSSHGHTGACVSFRADNGYSALKTQSFYLGDEKYLRMKSRIEGGTLEVYLSTNGGITYRDNKLRDIKISNEWIDTEISLQQFAGKQNACLVFVAKGDIENRNTGIYIDDIVVEDIPLCSRPINLYIQSLNESSAEIFWTVTNMGGIPEKYILNVSDDNGNKIKDNEEITAPDMFLELTELEPNTEYTMTLTGVCETGKGNSSVSDPLIFRTDCQPETIPYENTFNAEAGTIPECWTTTGDVTLVKDPANIVNNRVLKLTSTLTDGAYVYTPRLGHASDDMMLTMKVYGAKNIRYEVSVGTNAADASSFSSIYNGTITTANEWTEVTIFTKPSYWKEKKNTIIEIKISGGENRTLYIDDIKIEDAPNCLAPFDLRMETVSDQSMTIDWSEYVSSPNYEVKFVNAENQEYTTTAQQHPVTITGEGLRPDNKYTVSVRALCNTEESSDWSETINISTLCSPAATPVMFEGFEDKTFPPACWFQRQTVKGESGTYNRGDKAWTRNGTKANVYEGTGVMACARQYKGIRSIIMPPAFMIGEAERNKYMVQFYMKRVSQNVDEALQVWVNNRPDTVGGTKLGRINLQASREPAEVRGEGWYKYDFDIPQVGVVYVILEAVCEYGQQPFLIDNFEIKPVPNCRRVKDIKLIEPENKTAGISWTPVGNETEWTVDYKLTDEDGKETEKTGEIVTEPQLLLTDLKSTTRYSIAGSVAAKCADGESERLDFSYTFTTPCPWYPAEGFTENFENSFPEKCWSLYALDGNKLEDIPADKSNTWIRTESNPASGNGAIKFRSYGYNNEGCLLVTPIIDIPEDNNLYRLYVSMTKNDLYKEGDVVRVWCNDQISLTGATKLADLNAKATMTPEVTKDADGYYRFNIDLTKRGQQYIMFEARGKSGYDIYLDNIKIAKASGCEMVDNFAVEQVLHNSAQVKMYDTSVSDWQVSYGSADSHFNPEDGTKQVVSGNICTINGLKSGTSYRIYVRAICNGSYGPWSERAIEFFTLCDPLKITGTTPFFEGFEGMTAGQAIAGCYQQEELIQSAKGNKNALLKASGTTTDIKPYDGQQFAVMSNNVADNWIFRYVELEKGVDYEISVWTRHVDNEIYGKEPRISVTYGHAPGAEAVDEYVINNAEVGTEWTEVKEYMTVPESGYYFVGINISDKKAYSLMAIDNINIKTCNCRLPDRMDHDKVTNNSAELSVRSNKADKYNFKVSDNPNFDPNTQEGNVADVKNHLNNILNLTGLRPNTVYYYSAQCVCSDGNSDWMRLQSFETQCNAINFPYHEDFEKGEESVECWTLLSGNAEVTVTAGQAHDGSNYSYAFERNAMVVSPEMEVESLADYMVSGWVKCKSKDTRVGIGVMFDPNDQSTYTELGSFEIYEAGTWLEFVTYFSALKNGDFDEETMKSNRVVITVTSGDMEMEKCYIDDLKIDYSPECRRPTEPKVEEVKATSITFSWTVNDKEKSWIMTAKNSSGIEVVNQVVTPTPKFENNRLMAQATVTGLHPATYYEFEITSDCSDGYSEPTYIGEVRTSCAEITDLPYHEDFEGISNIVRDYEYCFSFLWNKISAGKYPQAEMSSLSNAIQGKQSLAMYNDRDTALYVIMPQFNAPLGRLRMEYDYKNDYTGTFTGSDGNQYTYTNDIIVGAMTDVNDEKTFRQLDICTMNDKVTHYRVAFDTIDIPDGYENARIVLKYGPNQGFKFSNYLRGGYKAHIDNLVIEEIPACVEPRDIYIESLTDRTATVKIDGNDATAWQYVLGVTGFEPDKSTPIKTDKDLFTISSLEPRTYYDLYVRTNCGDKGTSLWTGPITFRTNCKQDMPVEWTENFEDLTSIDDGCFFINISSKSKRSSVSITKDAGYVSNGYTGMKVTLGRSETGDPKEYIYIALPHFNTPLNALKMYFDQLNFGTEDNKADMTVGVMSDLNDILSYKAVKTYKPNEDFNKRMERDIIDFKSFFDENALGEEYSLNGYIVFRFNNFEAGYGNSGTAANYTHFAIDNIKVVNSLFCNPPKEVKTTLILDTKAQFETSHIEGLTSFKYELRKADSKVKEGTSDKNGKITITGLTPQTGYTLRVYAECAANVYSDEYVETEFATLPVPATVPYTCDFEQTEENDRWIEVCNPQNKLIIGTAPEAQKEGIESFNSLYVSYNGDTYGYLSDAASYSIIYRSIELNPGIYTVSFDWKSLGEIADYGRVLMVPSSLELKPGMVGRANDPEKGFSIDGRNGLYGKSEWQIYTGEFEVPEGEGGIYKLVVLWNNNEQGGQGRPLAIDNIGITSVTCNAIDKMKVTSRGDRQVTVSFENPNIDASTEYVLSISETLDENAAPTPTSADNHTVITGLQPVTTYRVFMRSKCNDSEHSSWRSIQFSTESEAAEVPYTTSYETGDDNDGWTLCGNAKTGTFIFSNHMDVAVEYGDSAMYFHDELEGGHNGNRWCYGKNGPNYITYRAYAYRVLNFKPGQYYISYRWKCEGLKGEDFGRALLVPSTIDVELNRPLLKQDENGEYTDQLLDGIIPLDGGKEMSASIDQWNQQTATVDIATQSQYKLVFLYQVNINGKYSGGAKPLAIDDVHVEPLECGLANNIALSSLSDTEAKVIFDNVSGGEVTYVLSSEKNPDPAAAEKTGTETAATSLQFTGLEPETTYYLYLTVTCPDGKTSPMSEFRFTTMKQFAQLPLVAGFEDSEDLSYWTFREESGTRFIVGNAEGAVHVGKKSLYLTSYPGSSKNYEYTSYTRSTNIYTSLHLEPGEYLISYDWRSNGDYGGNDYGRIFLAPTSYTFNEDERFGKGTLPEGFIALDEGPLCHQDKWTKHISVFNIDKAENYNLIIHWYNDESNMTQPPLAIDELLLRANTCKMVTDLSVKDVTSTTATAHFTAVDNAIRYEYDLSLTPDVTDSYKHGSETNNEIRLTDLKPNTTNYLFVYTVCNDAPEDMSPARILPFRTYCDDIITITKETHFSTGFENDIEDNILDGCWIETPMDGIRQWTILRSNNAHTGDKNIGLGALTSNHLTHPVRLTSGSTYQMSAWVKYSPDYARIDPVVHLIIGDGLTYDTLTTVFPTKDYQCMKVEFEADRTGIYEIGFSTKSSIYDDLTNVCIDDILLKEIALLSPQNLRLKEAGINNATLEWDNNADRYQVQILNNEGVVKDIFVDEAEARVNDLQASTTYIARVRGILTASKDTSDWAELIFSTGCGTMELPYLETFEKTRGEELPGCWNNTNESRLNDGFTHNWFTDVERVTGNHYAAVLTNRTMGYAVLKTPDVFISDATFKIRFKYRTDFSNGEHLVVRVTDDNGITYPDTLLKVTQSSELNENKRAEWTETEHSLAAFAGKTISVAFEAKAMGNGVSTFVNIDDVRFYCYGTEELYEDKICWGQRYIGHGFNIKTDSVTGDNHGGLFEFTRISEAISTGHCDTIKTLRLTINPAGRFYLYDTICPGDVYEFEGHTYTKSTTIESQPHTTDCGCDSTLRVYLSVTHRQAIIYDTICEGAKYQFADREITESGIYRDTIPTGGEASANCSTITTLNLVVLPKYYVHADTICEGQSITWQDKHLNATGRYEEPFKNHRGCDSIEVMDLWVIPSETHQNTTICQGTSVIFSGKLYDKTGNYKAEYINCLGCDSVAWLHLTVTEPNDTTFTDWVCQNETYLSYGFDESGITGDTTLTRTTKNINGCDSIIRVILTYYPTVVVDTSVTINRGETYLLGDATLSEPGSYSSTLSTSHGCDSVVNLTLLVNTGIDAVHALPIIIAPNPVSVSETAYINKSWTAADQQGMTVEILNSLGQIIRRSVPKTFPVAIDPIAVSGIYYIRIVTGTGDTYIGKLIVQ